MRKFLVFICFILAFTTKGMAKETTYTKELFDKALSDGKVVVVSSWIKYCTSCASQMKVCLLYTSPSPRDRSLSRMPSSA